MNTEKSKKKARDFLIKENNLKRKQVIVEKIFSSPPEKVFPQLCPSRELDWIEGWDCDLLYTSTGYMEKDCIFTTAESNSMGPGLWITSAYEPNQKLDLVRIIGDSAVEHCTINLIDNHDGTCTGVWDMTVTALTDSGNEIVESLLDDDPDLNRALENLDQLLKTG